MERKSTAERFWEKVDICEWDDHSCWIWTAYTNGGGYGRFWVGGRNVQAHRFAYESLRGSIPAGVDLDHLCRNRACVNPSHAEPVTHAENCRRGQGWSGLNVAKTHCPAGHPYAGDNLKVARRPDGKRYRYCLTCREQRDRERTARRRLVRPSCSTKEAP